MSDADDVVAFIEEHLDRKVADWQRRILASVFVDPPPEGFFASSVAATSSPINYESLIHGFHEATWPHVVIIAAEDVTEANVDQVRAICKAEKRWVEQVVRSRWAPSGTVYLTVPPSAFPRVHLDTWSL